MPYYPDGSIYDPSIAGSPYLGPEPGVTFGWLSPEHPYPIGQCPTDTLDAIERAAETPMHRMRGYQACLLCEPARDVHEYLTKSGRHLWIGDATAVLLDRTGIKWFAPTLVLHYICDHLYLPPSPGWVLPCSHLPVDS